MFFSLSISFFDVFLILKIFCTVKYVSLALFILSSKSLSFDQRNILLSDPDTGVYILANENDWSRQLHIAEFQNFRNLSQTLLVGWATTRWPFEARLGSLLLTWRTFETRPLNLKIYKVNFRIGNSRLVGWKLPRECSSPYHLLPMIFRPSQILHHVRESAVHSVKKKKTFHAFCNISKHTSIFHKNSAWHYSPL